MSIFNIGNQTAGKSIINVGLDEIEKPDFTTIWKYRLELKYDQIIEIPARAKILTAQNQGDTIQLWALVNPKLPKEKRKIRIVGTGNDVSGILIYISTVQMERGMLVWHIFEVKS